MFCRGIIVPAMSRPLVRNFSGLTPVSAQLNKVTNRTCQPRTNAIKLPQLDIYRHYAKGKNIKKEKNKPKVQVDERQLAELIDVDKLKGQMEKSLEVLKNEFMKHLSLRSSTGSIESLPIKIDGVEHKLQELAQIVRKNQKNIVINMSMFPQAIQSALKALEKSGMNLNPQQDGTNIYIPIPQVTKEHREALSKNAHQLFVKCRTSVRDAQIKFIKQLKKKEGVSEDMIRSAESQITAIADKYISQAQEIFDSKVKELLGGSKDK